MKNTNYFQHDHNSRGDEKILKMRLIHGWYGFGIYWALVEKLYESTNGDLEKNYPLLAYDLKTEEKILKSIIEDFGLFNLSEGIFSHKRVKEHNVFRVKQSESGRKGAMSLHYGSAIAQPKQSHDHKGKKGKKGKKGNKENNTMVHEVIAYLNEKTKRNYSATNKSTVFLIGRRILEGRTKEDLFKVIDKKTSQWLNDEKMAKFLRPETLFNDTKFESYLNEKGAYDGIPEYLRPPEKIKPT